MSYFRFFPNIDYKFGDEISTNLFPQLNVYVDIVDQIKNTQSAYTEINIFDDDRPDVVSYALYGTTENYWTFYLLNDHLRRQGWPISDNNVVEHAKKKHPNRTLTFREHMFDKFLIGQTLVGSQSAATGTVVSRNLNLGQVVVKPTNEPSQLIDFPYSGQSNSGFVFNYLNVTTTPSAVVEQINSTNAGTITSATSQGSVEEYLSVHHYENADGETVDIDPETAPGNSLIPKTFLDMYVEENNKLRRIKVFKQDVIDDVIDQFTNELR